MMIKKNVEFKWSLEVKEYFEKMKSTISNACFLCSPHFIKDLFFYTFASNLSIVVVLTQNNAENQEQPISFMSTNLHEYQLQYPTTHKHAYVVFRDIKHFIYYILKIHNKVIVPQLTVRLFFFQQEIGERRGNWITTIQGYAIEITPTKIGRGQGMCMLVVESHDNLNDN